MPLIPTQAIVTVTVKNLDPELAKAMLEQALIPYRDARIVSLTSTLNVWGWPFGHRDLIAAIEYLSEATSR